MVGLNNKPVVYFGRLAPSKGIDVLMEAFASASKRLKQESPQLWIVGGNKVEIQAARQRSLKHVEQLEKNNRVHWWGHVPHSALPIVLRQCGIFCFTSRYEPGGRTILEAMALGLVVLAYPNGFAAEVIEDGVNGFLIESHSAEDWSETLFKILTQKNLNQISDNAKSTIQNGFTMNHFFDRQWSCYEPFLT